MRVAIFTTSYPRTSEDDAGIFVSRLVDSLSLEDISGVVYVPRDQIEVDEKQGQFSIRRFKYWIFAKSRLAFGAGIMPNIRNAPTVALQAPGLLLGFFFAALKEPLNFQLIHANWLITAIPALLLSRRKGIPYIVTARGEDLRLLKSPFFRLLLKTPLRVCSAIVAVGDTVAEELKALIPEAASKIIIIENGITVRPTSEAERQKVSRERGLDESDIYLLFVGTVIPRKRLEMLLRTLPLLSQSSTVLLVCGRLADETYVETLKQLVTSLGLTKRVRFEGAIPPDQISSILSLSKLYLTASEFEGRPNAVLEAMAAGVPVVASDIPSHRELVTSNENGILFKDEFEAAAAINVLLNDAFRREQLGTAGKKTVQMLSWKKTAEKYSSLFNSVLHGKKAP